MNQLYRLLTLGAALLSVHLGWAQTGDNYRISRTHKVSNGSRSGGTSAQVTTQVTYYDGLGKPTQTVMAFGGGSKEDVAVSTEYDNQHRPTNTYLPTSFTSNGARFKSLGEVLTEAKAYYNSSRVAAGTQDVFSQTVYEPSPLSRVTNQKAPGAAQAVSQAHGVNDDGVVKRYQTGGPELTNITLNGTYNQGELTFVQTQDERSSVTVEYRDRYDRVVLKRVVNGDANLDTYYIYDERGQLRAVLQPKYQAADEGELNRNAFLYQYDSFGRLVAKKVPGANLMQMSYKAETDLLESSTDGKGQMFYYEYDPVLKRLTEMGLCNGACNPQDYASRTNKVALQRNYYDVYPATLTAGLGFSNELALDGPNHYYNQAELTTKRTGLLTGTESRILKTDGSVSDTDPMIRLVNYYDSKYRLIQSVRQLHGLVGAAYERVSYRLAFDGRVDEEWTTQYTGSMTYRLTKRHTYDHANRLARTDHAFFDNDLATPQKTYTHVQMAYNEVGQPRQKLLGRTQLLSYKHTPRGWLGSQATDAGQPFSQELTYQDDGNISGQNWATRSHTGGMSLSYDQAKRLTKATGTGGFAGYEEEIVKYEGQQQVGTYDRNGNMEGLYRKYNGVVIDQLTYRYNGNQLHRVDDAKDDEGQGVKGFVDRTEADNEMTYDGNGNLIKDDNRSLGSVTYNVLNLPARVSIGGKTVQYVYDGAGVKHQLLAANPSDNRTYAGAFEYNANGTLGRIGLEEGQLVRQDTFVVQYYLRDHLGNVRAVVDEGGSVLQETEYYAFGLPIKRLGAAVNKYLYNGKEQQPETEWLDYGARMYDPTIGRWMNIDPLAEGSSHYSPYTYAYDSPVLYIDPDGRESKSTHTDSLGNVVAVFNDGDLGVYKHMGNADEAKAEVDRLYSARYTSAGGDYMGETLHSLSFADHNAYNNYGTVRSATGAKIDFNSSWAMSEVNEILKNDPSVFEYQSKAGVGQVWDLKSKVSPTNGSIIGVNGRGNIYASARDAGNFAAGAVAAKSNFPTWMILDGFGAYNIVQNKYGAIAFQLVDYLSVPTLPFVKNHGEDTVTFMAITAGINRYKEFFPIRRR